MKITKNIGLLLLAIFLILTGLVPLLKISSRFLLATLMPILAIVAGVFIVIEK